MRFISAAAMRRLAGETCSSINGDLAGRGRLGTLGTFASGKLIDELIEVVTHGYCPKRVLLPRLVTFGTLSEPRKVGC